MRKPGIDTVIIGARNEPQLRDNLAAANLLIPRRHPRATTRAAADAVEAGFICIVRLAPPPGGRAWPAAMH